MKIKGYVEIVTFHLQTWYTCYDIVELVRYQGDLWWRWDDTAVNAKWKIKDKPHITTWHFGHGADSSVMYEGNNLGLAFKYEVHHLERVWCRNDYENLCISAV